MMLALVSLGGCAQWNELEPAEKVGVAVAGSVVVGALIIRNGQGQSQSQCISTRSLETGCPR